MATRTSKAFAPRKLLVAAVGVATINYFAACNPNPPTSGNLPAPRPEPAGDAGAPTPPALDASLPPTSGNLPAPVPMDAGKR